MAPSICRYMMGNTFTAFHKIHPDVLFKIIEAETDRMLDMLRKNDADLIFAVDKIEYGKDFIIASKAPIKTHFVVRKKEDFNLTDKPLSIFDIIDKPFLLTEKKLSYRNLLDEKLAEKEIEISPLVEMGNTDLILELVKLGVGISFLPDYVTKESKKKGEVEYLQVEDFDLQIYCQLMYHKDKWISPSMKKVLDYCTEVSHKISD